MSTKQSKYNLIDPSQMNESELEQLITTTTLTKQSYQEQERAVYKRVRGKLWLWWFLPIFGWVIYTMVYSRRLEQETAQTQLVGVKTKIAECELQEVFIQRRQKTLNEEK